MKTRLSEIFFQSKLIDKKKTLLEAFAVTPIPESDFIELTNEFSKLKSKDDVSFNSHLLVDGGLIDILLRSRKKYANFYFVERKKNISLLLHLSNNISSLDSDDKVFTFDENQINGMTIYTLTELSDTFSLLVEKTNYEEGLGDYINQVTNKINTRIVSYEKEDISLFHHTTFKDYPDMEQYFKYIKISFIVFKGIKGSVLNSEYKKRLGRISIALQYYFEMPDDKVISLSSPSDITSLWP
ncbi:hypothetical protein [Chryseobacterium herbae]|uniref:Uncharacterized protein n=1 Tax=Chryseobacterium herbae TaxID=2976476 RepID=A0ABT2IVY2_9FLAO|nr:hypothetical protein [Chryseobacterium sp. pc1-10]MCT2563004.1 hypothetical protein [Chryseobacterium sp. pc1-10]